VQSSKLPVISRVWDDVLLTLYYTVLIVHWFVVRSRRCWVFVAHHVSSTTERRRRTAIDN